MTRSTTSFYAPPENFLNGRVTLPADESRHAARVLRHQSGDEVVVVDGSGSAHHVALESVDSRAVTGRVVSTVRNENELARRISMACGVLRQPARFETLIEKLVELGVHEIIPLVTARTEKPRVKMDRLRKIAIAAMKQSGRCRLPQIRDVTTLDVLLAMNPGGLSLICHERSTDEPLLNELLESEEWSAAVILIGPEGGFSDEEVARAVAAGFRTTHLGARRLRGETAAMLAAGAAMLAAEHSDRRRR